MKRSLVIINWVLVPYVAIWGILGHKPGLLQKYVSECWRVTRYGVNRKES